MKFLPLSALLLMLGTSACTPSLKENGSTLAFSPVKTQAPPLTFGGIDGLNEKEQNNLNIAIMKAAKVYNISFSNKAGFAILRGYIAHEVDEDDNGISVYYVFDLLNKNGQRLYRVGGHQAITKAKDNSNFHLDNADYSAIAQDLIQKLALWHQNNTKTNG